jgi:hypothetical protein
MKKIHVFFDDGIVITIAILYFIHQPVFYLKQLNFVFFFFCFVCTSQETIYISSLSLIG